MRIVVGADHRGFALKDVIAGRLRRDGHEMLDVGTNSDAPVDYPDIAVAAGGAIRDGLAERGILVCGSGVGAVIAANKLAGIRAGLCHDTYSAHQGVEHDNMNLLCIGSGVVGEDLALEVVRAFIGAKFSGEERYRRRLAKVAALEKRAETPVPAGRGPSTGPAQGWDPEPREGGAPSAGPGVEKESGNA